MEAFILIAILLFSTGCASKPILAKKCVQAESTDVWVCQKY